MALIVENGQGSDQADSFFGLDEAATFFSERGMPTWAAASPTARESAARQAADYLGFAYSWKGRPASAAQRLCWPRADVFDADRQSAIAHDAVPRAVREAAMLLAHMALATSLLEERPADRIVESERKELAGVGSTETRYAVSRAKQADVQRYSSVDAMLAPLVLATRSSGGLQSYAAVRR